MKKTGQLSKSTKKWDTSTLSIFLIFLSTALQSCWGFARDSPPLFKLIIALFCWISIFYAYKSREAFCAFSKRYIWIVNLLIIDCVWASFYTLCFGSVIDGNKYVVLLTNMSASLNLFGVLFIFVVYSYNHLRFILKLTFGIIVCNALLLIFNFQTTTHAYFLSYSISYGALFLPYVRFREKCFLIIGALMSLFAFWGGGRQIIITLLFAFVAYCVTKFFGRKIIYTVSLVLISLPIYFIWFWGRYLGSIFGRIESIVSDSENLSGNTRTFLYMECMEDVLSKDWLYRFLGEGATAYYQSDFFGGMRFGIEVPVLQWILQGGLFFYILFTIICLVAIYFLYKYGKNRMCGMMSILISAFFFMCHISNLTGCNIMHLGFWMMIGMAFNPLFLNTQDRDIRLKLSGLSR